MFYYFRLLLARLKLTIFAVIAFSAMALVQMIVVRKIDPITAVKICLGAVIALLVLKMWLVAILRDNIFSRKSFHSPFPLFMISLLMLIPAAILMMPLFGVSFPKI